MSNVLGIMYPVDEVIKKAHSVGAKVLIDGCQAVVHMEIDVVSMDCDFYVLSSHKLYGPSGVGVLYGKKEILESLPPYQGGGGMVGTVSYEDVSYAAIPARFEAGTPAIAEAVGLGYAIDYINNIGMDNIHNYETELSQYMLEGLNSLRWVHQVGNSVDKRDIFTFYIEEIHPQDIAMILNKLGIAVRSGTHCAEPLHSRLRVPFNTSTRASLGLYNTKADIEKFIKALERVKDFF